MMSLSRMSRISQSLIGRDRTEPAQAEGEDGMAAQHTTADARRRNAQHTPNLPDATCSITWRLGLEVMISLKGWELGC